MFAGLDISHRGDRDEIMRVRRQDTKLNQALWALGADMAKVKQAA
jgi:hypothetical protein